MEKTQRRFVSFGLAGAAWVLAAAVVSLHGQVAVRNQGYVPFSDEPINYRGAVNDPVARLQQRLDRGDDTLTYEPGRGYLRSVLARLQVPVSSQTLVFSKTSFQYRRITPEFPRALYFNDDVYVGQVHEGKALEVIAFDPRQGAIFYILDDQPVERPAFQRAELDCIQCHVAAGTRGVPGVLVRSVFPNPTGTQAALAPSFITGHQSPLRERFGGWYVTGSHGRARHMGNAVVRNRAKPEDIDRDAGANLADLSSRLDTSRYLTPHSDIVAQLVQAHQTQLHNLMTLTNYQTRLALHADAERRRAASAPDAGPSPEARAQYERPAEELVRYLVFASEAPLEDPVRGTSGFAEEFVARGPRDGKGRSLRELDLQTRLFKYPVSYLIYSESFDAIPEPAKSYVYRRLFEILTGRDASPDFSRLSAADRAAALEILIATKPELPAEWRTLTSRHSSRNTNRSTR